MSVVVVVVVVVQDKRMHAWIKHITMSFAFFSFSGRKIPAEITIYMRLSSDLPKGSTTELD